MNSNSKKLLATLLIPFTLQSALAYEPAKFAGRSFDIKSKGKLTTDSPLISYDSFNGSLNTGFALPLYHLNKNLPNKLNFSYSSSAKSNVGIGLGFSVTLPRFYPNPSSTRANFILEYMGKSVEYQVDENNGYETDLTFFSKLVKENDQYIITFPSGKKLIFSATTGQILEERDLFRKANIKYQWDNGHLKKIDLYNKLSVAFNYKKCDVSDHEIKNLFEYSSYYKGTKVDNSLCLESIVYPENKVIFNYDNGYLTKVNWENDETFPIFQAEYNDNATLPNVEEIKKQVYGSPAKDSLSLSLGDYGVRFISRNDLLARFQVVPASDKIGFKSNVSFGNVFTTDLNNDGITDLVIESQQHIGGVVDEDTFSDDDFTQDQDDKAHIPEPGSKHMYIYFGSVNQSKNDLEFAQKAGFTLDNRFNTLFLVLSVFPHHYPVHYLYNDASLHAWDALSRVEDYSAYGYNANSLLIGDFNGDNTTDIVVCGDNNLISYNNVTKLSSPVTHNFPCTRESMALDVNNDGLSDIITKDAIHLNFRTHFEKLTDDSKYRELKDYLSAQEKINHSGKHINYTEKKHKEALSEISEKYKDKKIYQEHPSDNYTLVADTRYKQVVQIGSERTPLIFTESMSGTFFQNQKLKRISSIIDSFNKKTEISYKFLGAKAVVDTVTVQNKDYSHSQKLDFKNPIFDPSTSQLLGYQFLKMSISDDVNSQGKEKYYVFYTDSRKKDLLKRTPIHGRVDTLATCEISKCSKLNQYFNNEIKEDIIPLKEPEHIERNDWGYLTHNQLGSNFKENQIFKTNNSINKFIQVGKDGNHSHKVLTTKNIYSNFTTSGPLKSSIQKFEGIGVPYPINSKSAFPFLEETSSFGFYKGVLLPISNEKFNFNGDIKSKNISSISYSGNPGEKNFTVAISKKLNEETTVTTNSIYDAKGRILTQTNKLGLQKSYNYSSDEGIVTFNDGKIITITVKDELGLTKKSTMFDKENNIIENTEYVHISPVQIKEITHNRDLYTLSNNISNTVKSHIVWSRDNKTIEEYSLEYDNFGNIISEIETKDGITRLTSKKIFNSKGQEIENFIPKHNSLESLKSTSTFYDFMGRKSKNINHLNGVIHEWMYKNGVKKSLQNNIVLSEEVENASGIQSNVNLVNEEFYVEESLDNKVQGLKTSQHELKFGYNANNSINRVTLNNRKEIYSSKITTDEFIVNRLFKYKQNQREQVEAFSGPGINIKYNFDSRDRLKSIIQNGTDKTIVNYDQENNIDDITYTSGSNKLEVKYNRTEDYSIKSETINNSYNLEYEKEGKSLISIPGLIENIEYDVFGYIKSIKYTNGIQVNYTHNKMGEITSFNVEDYKEEYKRDDNNLINEMLSNISDSKTYKYDDNLKFQGTPFLKQDSQWKNTFGKRDRFLNLKNGGFSNHKSLILGLKDLEFQNLEYERLLGFRNIKKANEKTIYFANQLHFINGKWIKYLAEKGQIIGALVIDGNDTQFYPIISDVRASVRLVYNQEGKLVIKKNYDDWGRLLEDSSFALDNVDKIITLDYSRLKRPSLESPYLFSNSRIYYPALGEWASVDPLLIKSPSVFTNKRFFEIDGLKYASNDPINFIDPSGNFAVTTGLLIVGAVNAGAMGSAWLAAKAAMYFGGTNTPENNASLNKGLAIGTGLGFAPAAAVSSGVAAYQLANSTVIMANMTYAARPDWYSNAYNFIVGRFDPALPSGKWDTLGALYGFKDQIIDIAHDFYNNTAQMYNDMMRERNQQFDFSFEEFNEYQRFNFEFEQRNMEVREYNHSHGYTRDNGYAEAGPGMAEM